jgi:toxin ParE1/3/4
LLDLVIRALARDDLRAILAYGIEAFGRERAESYLREIDEAINRVREFPEIGSIYFGLRQPLRSVTSGKHRIFYERSGKIILIVRVLHQSMDVSARL